MWDFTPGAGRWLAFGRTWTAGLVSVMTLNDRLLQGQDRRPHHLRSAGPFTGDAHAHADGADGDIVVENWRKVVEDFSEAGKQNDMGRNEVQGA